MSAADFAEWHELSPAEQAQRAIDGEIRAAGQLGLSVERLRQLCEPPRAPVAKLRQFVPRCHSCGQALPR